jgi:hypothetical protein
MAQRKTLTLDQIELLRWVEEGCPEGVYEGVYHRISVAALRNRGLVQVHGRGPSWSATITTEGREYLAEVDGPTPPVPRQANKPVTEQLIDDVVAAGGVLRVERGYGRSDWQQRVRQAIRHNKVPAGKRLEYSSNWRDDFAEIHLVDAPAGTTPVLLPVPVPERVARYHPTVQAVRKDKDRLEVSNAALPRASRVLHALVVEAERRQMTVSIPAGHRSRETNKLEWAAGTDGHVVFTTGAWDQAIMLHEEGLRIDTVYKRPPYEPSDPWDLRRAGVYRRVRDDSQATGRLVLELVSPHRSDRTAQWADRKRWTLEDKLPEVLAEIVVRAAEAEHERLEAERRAAARQVAWETAMAEAHERCYQARCAEILDQQVEAWEHAERIRRYCDHLESHHNGGTPAQEWVTWARAHGDRLDPARQVPQMPDRPEKVTPEDLRPFLDGWSPYGPEAKY